VSSGAVAIYTAQSEETTASALETQTTTNYDVLANSEAADGALLQYHQNCHKFSQNLYDLAK